MRRPIVFAALLAVAAVLSAETLRGPLRSQLVVTSDPRSLVRATVYPNDLITVEVEGEVALLDAIEVEIQLPRELLDLQGALALRVVDPRTAAEEDSVAEFNGDELYAEAIIGTGRAFVLIPLDAQSNLAPGPATTLAEIRQIGAYPLALAIQPVLKGLPDSAYELEFGLTVRPVVKDLGITEVDFCTEDGHSIAAPTAAASGVAVYVDGARIELGQELLLPPGLHRAALASPLHNDHEVTFAVERGRRTTVEIPLVPAQATIRFDAPRGSVVYIDGRRMAGENGDFTIDPGEHTMTVALGDYTVSRRFVVESRREYNLSISLDIVVTETK